eukprot:scaffold8599_cov110-Isochrysis_galbana.AAC.13
MTGTRGLGHGTDQRRRAYSLRLNALNAWPSLSTARNPSPGFDPRPTAVAPAPRPAAPRSAPCRACAVSRRRAWKFAL